MIRRHALTNLVLVAAAVALLQSLRVDAPDESWDPREGSARLFCRQEAQPKQPPGGSPTAKTVEKWRGSPRLRIAHAVNFPSSSRPTGVRLHLVSMSSFFSTSPIIDPDTGEVIEPGSCQGGFASVQPNGTSRGSLCSTVFTPASSGGQCSTSMTTGGGSGYRCSTASNAQYCSTGAAQNGDGATACSTDGGQAGVGTTLECSTSSGGFCSTKGTQSQNATCSTSKNPGNQDCSTGNFSGSAGAVGEGFCSAANGSGAGKSVCSTDRNSGADSNCSASGATPTYQQCSTINTPNQSSDNRVCSVTQAATGNANAPSCTSFSGAANAANTTCSAFGDAAKPNNSSCSVLAGGPPPAWISGPNQNNICSANPPL